MLPAAPGTARIKRDSVSHEFGFLGEDKVALTGDVLVDAGEDSVPESVSVLKSKGHSDGLVWCWVVGQLCFCWKGLL